VYIRRSATSLCSYEIMVINHEYLVVENDDTKND
jgi:hypothetical protein